MLVFAGRTTLCFICSASEVLACILWAESFQRCTEHFSGRVFSAREGNTCSLKETRRPWPRQNVEGKSVIIISQFRSEIYGSATHPQCVSASPSYDVECHFPYFLRVFDVLEVDVAEYRIVN
ncbi:hypothetical protein BDN70DRAFT_538914 [Pholiota conissans]|uniref:Secreted protein n=1 Tax=Pholiota conissans TaxID=109636 RepID=A0A9P5ZEK3_9AGAR|nr:hypothetical protein BDN70DRAFT_538914 [Pholiota conissans]